MCAYIHIYIYIYIYIYVYLCVCVCMIKVLHYFTLSLYIHTYHLFYTHMYMCACLLGEGMKICKIIYCGERIYTLISCFTISYIYLPSDLFSFFSNAYTHPHTPHTHYIYISMHVITQTVRTRSMEHKVNILKGV